VVAVRRTAASLRRVQAGEAGCDLSRDYGQASLAKYLLASGREPNFLDFLAGLADALELLPHEVRSFDRPHERADELNGARHPSVRDVLLDLHA
jgi:hypothetical protein